MEENAKGLNEDIKQGEQEVKKLSYEELEKYAQELSQQVNMLYARLQEANAGMLLKRLDYLFKALENDSKFNNDFVSKCAEEIVAIMTPRNSEEEEKK